MKKKEGTIRLVPKLRASTFDYKQLRIRGYVCPYCGRGCYGRNMCVLTKHYGWLCQVCRLKGAKLVPGRYCVNKHHVAFKIGSTGLPVYPYGAVNWWPDDAEYVGQREGRLLFLEQQASMFKLVVEYLPWMKKKAMELKRKYERVSEAGKIRPYFDYESGYDICLSAAMRGSCKSKGSRVFGFICNEMKELLRRELKRRETRAKWECKLVNEGDGSTCSVEEERERQLQRELYYRRLSDVVTLIEMAADVDVWFVMERVYVMGNSFKEAAAMLNSDATAGALVQKLHQYKRAMLGNFKYEELMQDRAF